MNKKQFIESQGATCINWRWSWSFINAQEKIIIFGAWDKDTDGNTSLILNEDWQISRKGRKQPAYQQSREHIRLVEEDGYKLKTFPIIYSSADDMDATSPAKIKGFIPKLTNKSLTKVGNCWYASDDFLENIIPEEIGSPEKYIEGASKVISVNSYERNLSAREKCIEHYGYKCAICSFDFEMFYGSIGKNYIHVHHVVPLAVIKREYVMNPIKDLIPVCPNCHAIIHKTRPALTVEQLRQHLKTRK